MIGMEDWEEIKNRAMQLEAEADNLSEEEKHEKALIKYKQLLQYLLYALKHVPNKSEELKLEDKIGECNSHIDDMVREIQLKSLIGYKEEIKEKPTVDKVLSLAIKIEKPDYKWEDVAAVSKAKEELKASIHKGVYGVLLHGPPGTGKIYLAKACATEMHASLYSTSLSDCAAKWRKDAKRIVNAIFEGAKANRPAVIFIGEVDLLLSKTNSNEVEDVIEELSEQMKSIEQDPKNILILVGSNNPWKINDEVLKMFKNRIYIPLHDKEARIRLFKRILKDIVNVITEEEYEKLGELTELFSGWDISRLIKSARMASVNKCQNAKKFIITDEGFYIPACLSDSNGIDCTISTIPDPTKVKSSPICFGDLVNAFSSTSFGHFKANIEQYDKWNSEFGFIT